MSSSDHCCLSQIYDSQRVTEASTTGCKNVNCAIDTDYTSVLRARTAKIAPCYVASLENVTQVTHSLITPYLEPPF